jgi:hypothetical protein
VVSVSGAKVKISELRRIIQKGKFRRIALTVVDGL